MDNLRLILVITITVLLFAISSRTLELSYVTSLRFSIATARLSVCPRVRVMFVVSHYYTVLNTYDLIFNVYPSLVGGGTLKQQC